MDHLYRTSQSVLTPTKIQDNINTKHYLLHNLSNKDNYFQYYKGQFACTTGNLLLKKIVSF